MYLFALRSYKKVLYGPVQFLAGGIRVLFSSLIMSAPVSALFVLFEEHVTFRVLPLNTVILRDNMTAPC